MMRAWFAIAAVGTAALMCTELTATPALPFFDSADLTPRWTRSVAHRIGDFSLTTQTGEPLRRSDLLGKVHVATFVYTHCAGICPEMISQLSKLQRAIEGRRDVLMVSYSVTPSVDTPETLAMFAADRGIKSAVWKLVTGDANQIYTLARESYFADDGRLDAAAPAAEQFLHTEKALLVDREGRLRGVYNATLPHEIDKVIADLNMLLAGS